ncbi:MAG: hemerythrin domain-containing protein [Gammaproteobacteria bacterium]|nr:hemerythrin domain-containing protein [Gammaproteobacteria bacterium]MDH3414578.1 hemerythrin domain-containing protein [Gammaproteobacteria bacterium]
MKILKQLDIDHGNVAQMLAILDKQLDNVHQMKPTDFDLMRDVMYYMTRYPDRTHHPLEDLVIRKLIEHDPSARELGENILREHQGLAEKGEAFLEMLVQVTDGAMVLREDIEEVGRNYVAFLRAHMEKEDERLFPLAEKTLKHNDWKEIARAIERRHDPVFGPMVDDQFRALYDFIQQQTA